MEDNNLYQKFFTNTIEGKFIKQLLSTTPVPMYKVVSFGDLIIKGCVYIYHTSIIRCTKTGYLPKAVTNIVSPDNIVSPTNILQGESGQYTIIGDYVFGDSTPNVTSTYVGKEQYYDSDTHKHLGEFLRAYRDLYGIDLLPFYNCFCYDVLTDIYLTTEGRYFEFGTNDNYKVIAIPIKFNQEYTIAIDCPSQVLMKSVVYNDLGMLRSNYLVNKYVTEDINETITIKSNLSFNKPVTYFLGTTNKDLYQNEKYLKLIIQLPKNNKSSIVVLEGSYTGALHHFMDCSSYNGLTDKMLNHTLISKLSLLQLNDGNYYAFSDRLIEYLLGNVNTPIDTISNNTYVFQKELGIANDVGVTKGAWDIPMRVNLYNQYMSAPNVSKLDINGFIDKNVEKYIEGNK